MSPEAAMAGRVLAGCRVGDGRLTPDRGDEAGWGSGVVATVGAGVASTGFGVAVTARSGGTPVDLARCACRNNSVAAESRGQPLTRSVPSSIALSYSPAAIAF